jgi:integrase
VRSLKLNKIELLPPAIEVSDGGRVSVYGIEFDEKYLAKLVVEELERGARKDTPLMSRAVEIYIADSLSGHKRKFQGDALWALKNFVEVCGDLPIGELQHQHICLVRDHILSKGLHPTTARKQTSILNAALNAAFKHLGIDRLSPFRSLRIRGEDENSRPMRIITSDLLKDVKACLMKKQTPYALVGLLQMNTGLRLSEPIYAKLDDLNLEHPIPHLWIRKTELSDRKTRSSIRAVPLVGVSLYAAERLKELAGHVRSEWLVDKYAYQGGSNSCSAIMNKRLKHLDFRSHMFRHALIDRMKACNDIPIPIAESITGHASTQSEFSSYGTIGYTLEQKVAVLKRVAV